MINAASSGLEEIGIRDLVMAVRKYALLVILVTVGMILGGFILSKVLPHKYAYVGLLEMGQVANVRGDGYVSTRPIADPSEIKSYLLFLNGSSEASENGATLDSVEIVKSPASDALTMFVLTAHAPALADAEEKLKRILPLVQKRYDVQLKDLIAGFQSQFKEIEIERASLKSTLDLMNERIKVIKDPSTTLGLLLYRKTLLTDIEKQSHLYDSFKEAASPEHTYNFKYVDLRPVSKDPVAPQTRKMLFLAALLGLVIGCLLAFALEFGKRS
jgi:hypothetical protein